MTDKKNENTLVPTIFNTRDGGVRQRIAIKASEAEKIVTTNGEAPIELLISADAPEGDSLPLLKEYTEILPSITIAIKEGDAWGRAAFTINGRYAENFHGGQGLIGVTTDIVNHPFFFSLQAPEEEGSEQSMTYSIKKEHAGLALQEFSLSGATSFFLDVTGEDYFKSIDAKRIVTNLGFRTIGETSLLNASTMIMLTGTEFSELMKLMSNNSQKLAGANDKDFKKLDKVKNYFVNSISSVTPYLISKEEGAFYDDVVSKMGITFPVASKEVEVEM